MYRTIAAMALAALLVGACGLVSPADPTGSLPPDGGAIPPAEPGALRYACGVFPFGPQMLDRRDTDERAASPIAAALRAHLAKPDMDIDILPDTGWTLAGQDGQRAEFVTMDDLDGMLFVTLSAEGGGWAVDGWGQCQPGRVLPPGLGQADWVLAPGETIGPGTQTFEALVTERDCASGQSSEGRIVGPDILEAGGDVLVTFAVRPLPGDAFTCQGNPATRVRVTLPEPLGDRRLLDGSTLPPREQVAQP